MAGATLGIQVKYNDREIRQALNHLARAGADLRPAFADIGEYLDLATRARFDAGRGPEAPPGSRWPSPPCGARC